MKRRDVLLGAAAALPLAALAQSAAPPFLVGAPTQRLIAKGKAPRVVICGGGWGGVSAAKALRQLAPQAEVILLERNPVFFSCPMSNKWLIDVVDTQFLTYDYLRVSEHHGYRYIQSEVLDIDREAKRVVTSLGWLDYDDLIIAPGIRYNYEAWFGQDRRLAEATRARFPGAYISNSEHFALKRELHAFKGGNWVMTLPPPPQRCPPSPYERACLIAWHFKKNKIKGHVTILDHKDDVRPIGPGFKAAFEELYKDYITYVPNAHVQEVDPFNKRIKTKAGDMAFDHAVLMAPHQAGDLAWKAGAVNLHAQGQPSGWVDLAHPMSLRLDNDPHVYVIGDAVGNVSPTFQYYPKAGHVANSHGHIVARYIAERLAGREPAPALPNNLCFMMVNGEPREAVSVLFDYALDGKGHIVQQQIDDNDRRPELVTADLSWARGIYANMFG